MSDAIHKFMQRTRSIMLGVLHKDLLCNIIALCSVPLIPLRWHLDSHLLIVHFNNISTSIISSSVCLSVCNIFPPVLLFCLCSLSFSLDENVWPSFLSQTKGRLFNVESLALSLFTGMNGELIWKHTLISYISTCTTEIIYAHSADVIYGQYNLLSHFTKH